MGWFGWEWGGSREVILAGSNPRSSCFRRLPSKPWGSVNRTFRQGSSTVPVVWSRRRWGRGCGPVATTAAAAPAAGLQVPRGPLLRRHRRRPGGPADGSRCGVAGWLFAAAAFVPIHHYIPPNQWFCGAWFRGQILTGKCGSQMAGPLRPSIGTRRRMRRRRREREVWSGRTRRPSSLRTTAASGRGTGSPAHGVVPATAAPMPPTRDRLDRFFLRSAGMGFMWW